MPRPVRPWGHLPFLLRHLQAGHWSLIGCLSTEERCLAARGILSSAGQLGPECWIEVDDGANRHRTRTLSLRAQRKGELLAAGCQSSAIQQHDLFEPYSQFIDAVEAFLSSGSAEVVFDITSFPKRYFFPILRRILENRAVTTLVVTYTEAAGYGTMPLSEDPEPLMHLPLYPPRYPEPEVSALVVGLGFQPLGLTEILEGTKTTSVNLLFPFSHDPTTRAAVWEFVRGMPEVLPVAARKPHTFVSAMDTPDIFDHLVAIGDQMRGYVILAPFGPKPMSLAMALAASAADWPVYYTQPRLYHPDYTTGIRMQDGMPVTYGYIIRLPNRAFYP